MQDRSIVWLPLRRTGFLLVVVRYIGSVAVSMRKKLLAYMRVFIANVRVSDAMY